MRLYLDTNVVVSLHAPDALTGQAERVIASQPWILTLCDFARAEFAAVIAQRVRTAALTEIEARSAFGQLDHWADRYTAACELTPDDVAAADWMLRRLDLPLRAPDALHVAVARRIEATLATFDAKLARAATALGVAVVP